MRAPPDLIKGIETKLSRFNTSSRTAQKRAAVALIIVEAGTGPELPGMAIHENWSSLPALVLTIRAATLNNHAGQWALPGGRIDKLESPLEAAIRETSEEINLRLTPDNLLGTLDDFVTRSGYVMTPFVFYGGKPKEMFPNPAEVASIHRIPFTELLRRDAPMLDYDELSQHATQTNTKVTQPVLRMPIGNSWIAAPTAAILYQFREVCLLDKHTRVAHYEQPEFAWR